MTAINPVGTWTDPNFQAQTGTAYKTSIDNAIVAAKRIADAFAPHAATPPALSVIIEPGYVLDDVTLVETAAQTIASIGAPVTHPRIDRIVVDKMTGAATRVAGSEAASPTAPAIPEEKYPCCRIALAVGQTSITNAHIYDERVLGAGGAGAVVKLKSGTNQTIAGTAEATITAATKTLPAGLLGTNNFIEWFVDIAAFDCLDGSTTTFRVKLGGSTLCTLQVTASGADALGRNGLLWVRLANDGAVNAQRVSAGLSLDAAQPAKVGGGSMAFGTGAIDTTAARDLTITVQHDNINNTLTVVAQAGIKFS